MRVLLVVLASFLLMAAEAPKIPSARKALEAEENYRRAEEKRMRGLDAKTTKEKSAGPRAPATAKPKVAKPKAAPKPDRKAATAKPKRDAKPAAPKTKAAKPKTPEAPVQAIDKNSKEASKRWEAGVEAYVKGEFTKAYEQWRPIAEGGHRRAQYGLYQLYRRGVGVAEKDVELAVEWLKKSAENGLGHAQYLLADRLVRGEGIDEDRKRAMYWYRLAAKNGNKDALFKLAGLHYAGTGGIARNDKLAIKYYRGAAEAGHPAALTTMGVLYFNGRIVKKSEKKARDWWNRAARAGEINAMVFLARIYHRSTKLPRDYVNAYVWYSIAAERGDVSAKKERTELIRVMRDIEVSRGKKLLVTTRRQVKG